MAVTRTSDTVSIAIAEEEDITRKEEKQMLQEITREDNQMIKLGEKKKYRAPNPISDPESPPSPHPSDHRSPPSPAPSDPPPPPLPSPLPPCTSICPNIHSYCRDRLLYSKEVCEHLLNLLHTNRRY